MEFNAYTIRMTDKQDHLSWLEVGHFLGNIKTTDHPDAGINKL
jgi:hypothetical protein